MKLIIVEKRSYKNHLSEIIEDSKPLQNLLGNYKIFSINYNPEIFKLTDKISNNKFTLKYENHEYGAINTSDEHFPFNPSRYNYEILNQKDFELLKNLINEADTIINACDSDRLGNMKFNSIVYSGFFNIKNKKIKTFTVKNGLFNSLGYFEDFLNLRSNKKVTKKLKKHSILSLWGLDYEIAFNEVNWKNIDLNKKYFINKEILEKYSQKYNLNLLSLKNKFPNGCFYDYEKQTSNFTFKQVYDLLKCNCINSEKI